MLFYLFTFVHIFFPRNELCKTTKCPEAFSFESVRRIVCIRASNGFEYSSIPTTDRRLSHYKNKKIICVNFSDTKFCINYAMWYFECQLESTSTSLCKCVSVGTAWHTMHVNYAGRQCIAEKALDRQKQAVFTRYNPILLLFKYRLLFHLNNFEP